MKVVVLEREKKKKRIEKGKLVCLADIREHQRFTNLRE